MYTHICTFLYVLNGYMVFFFWYLFAFCLNYLSWVSITTIKKVLSTFFAITTYAITIYDFAIVTFGFSIIARFLLGVILREVTRSGSM